MELFNDYDLNQRVTRIKAKIDEATNPNRIEEITENGISIAHHLLVDTFDDLDYIKSKVGSSNSNYIEVAEGIALAASGCIKFPVSFMMMKSHAGDFHQTPGLKGEIGTKLGEATRLMAQISSMPMNYEARLLINRVTQMITQTETQINGGSGGCFIATVCYNDYNSYEVLLLRTYRDKVLINKRFGRIAIDLYYLFSPPIANIIKKSDGLKIFIKKYLIDIIVSRIEERVLRNI